MAWAQSLWVAKNLEKHHPHLQVELCGIQTLGDQILTSLPKTEGKEFFVAELDEALRSKQVDMTVHSLKDLSLERPEDFALCIPQRENPRDLLIFGPKILEHLSSQEPLKIGTSSPRRLQNTPLFLEKALPYLQKPCSLIWEEIRGNVTTRLERLHTEDRSRRLQAVVLAFAGLIRLGKDPQGQKELRSLLQDTRFMVLPLSECPTAPGQGALAIECLKNTGMQEILQCLHDPQTAALVHRERTFLAEAGGGCHQRFGASVTSSPEFPWILHARGLSTHGKAVDCFQWKAPEASAEEAIAWDGSQWAPEIHMLQKTFDSEHQAFFLAHARALPEVLPTDFLQKRIWTSGVKSWFRLAKRGIWVEGCAEGLGFESCLSTLQEEVLKLPPLSHWTALTHADAKEAWQAHGMQVHAPYQVRYPLSEAQKQELKKSTHFFWASGFQYDQCKKWLPEDACHACGPGKTALHLRQKGLSPLVFPEPGEWRKWIKN